MLPEEYNKAKEDIVLRLGPAFKGNGFETEDNECQRQLNALKGKYMADARAAKRLQSKAGEAQASIPEAKIDKEAKDAVGTALSGLTGFVPLEEDLKGFSELEKGVLRVYLVNQHIEPKKLANSFGKSYQFIAGLLNSKGVQLLRAKYFHKQLDNNTKIGLLKLTEEADPKITLAAAEYLKILHEKEKEDEGLGLIQDIKAQKALQMLGDWIVGEEEELRIRRSELG